MDRHDTISSNRDLLTLQEHDFIYGSTHVDASDNPYIPVILNQLNRLNPKLFKRSINEIAKQRGEIGFVLSGIATATILGFAGKRLAFELKPLNLKTGETTEDPTILGIWNEEENKIDSIPKKDLTAELRKALEDLGHELHLRPKQKEGKEGDLGKGHRGPENLS